MSGRIAPTIKVVGSPYTDAGYLRAAFRASERIWRDYGILVDVEFDNIDVVNYLAGVGVPDPHMVILRLGGEEKAIPVSPDIGEDELEQLIVAEVLRSLLASEIVIESVHTLAGTGKPSVALAGAAS